MSKNRFASIQNPEELRKLPKKELSNFAAALRKDIIHALAKGEGHLGSSLGTVELTVALHYCFDTPKDVLLTSFSILFVYLISLPKFWK